MNKHIFLLFYFFAFCISASAQITFQEIIGNLVAHESAKAMRPSADGGYIICGETDLFGGANNDIYLVKADSQGDTVWAKAFGGFNLDFGNTVEQTTDSGFIVAGQTFNITGTDANVYLIKTNSAGDTIWTKTYGGPGYDGANAIDQTTDGGYIVTGTTQSFDGSHQHIYLIRTDSNGDTLWTKTYGGANDDIGYSVRQTTDGGFIIAGSSNSFSLSMSAYLIKTDVDGNVVWSKNFSGATSQVANAVRQTADGGYIFTGSTCCMGAGNMDVYLVKTNANGDTLWTKAFGGPGQDDSFDVSPTTDGGYIVGGYTIDVAASNPDAYLIKTDDAGNLLWSKTYGGPLQDFAFSARPTADGGYSMIATSSELATQHVNLHLIKTDSTGNSGCNESTAATIVTIPGPVVTTPQTIITSPPTQETFWITNVFNATDFSSVNTYCTSLAIMSFTNQDTQGVILSPNPANGTFTVFFAAEVKKGRVEIYSLTGNKIYAGEINYTSKTEISLKNSSDGMYFVKLSEGNKLYYNKLIIKKL